MIAAKKAKNDEFYTQLSDISAELTHQEYLNEFRGKWIYCNCDNPEISQFYRFFVLYFQKLGISRLTCTYLAGTSGSKNPVAYRYDIYGDLNGNGIIDDGDIEITQLTGNGSFDSPECLEILQACDVVVTNPPFSLFREYISLLENYQKKYLIMGNINAVNHLAPLIRDNKIWPGYKFNGKPLEFEIPSSYSFTSSYNNGIIVNKKQLVKVVIGWWTNIELKKRLSPFILTKNYFGNENNYPKLDNYDAINIDRAVDIPKDYFEVMAVPVSFIDKICPNQFSVIGVTYSKDRDPRIEQYRTDQKRVHSPFLNGKELYPRLLIKRK